MATETITTAEAAITTTYKNPHRGHSWDEVAQDLLTPEERAASAIRVAMMIEISTARKERGLTQKKLEELSGVKQPIIARMERGSTSPQLETVLKVLAALGKTLCIADLGR
jgi:DNA-binding XRE family transcriptional regulator